MGAYKNLRDEMLDAAHTEGEILFIDEVKALLIQTAYASGVVDQQQAKRIAEEVLELSEGRARSAVNVIESEVRL